MKIFHFLGEIFKIQGIISMRAMEGATWTCSEILVISFEKLQVKLLWKFKFVYNFYII